MARYLLRTPRFIDGRYIHARVDAPAVVELPPGIQPSPDMELVDDVQASPAPATASHYAVKGQEASAAPSLDGKKPKPAARASKDDPL